jgi:hypothetical protein
MKNASCSLRNAIGQVEPETHRLPRSSEVPWRLMEHGMEQHQGDHLLSEPRGREIFLALVDALERKMVVLESRRWIAKRFRVSDRQIRRIECEGLDRQGPPL